MRSHQIIAALSAFPGPAFGNSSSTACFIFIFIEIFAFISLHQGEVLRGGTPQSPKHLNHLLTPLTTGIFYLPAVPRRWQQQEEKLQGAESSYLLVSGE